MWNDVAPYILHLAEPKWYNDPVVKNGYLRGSETEEYVRSIMQRWKDYRGSARASSSGSTPAPAHKSLQNGEYQSQVKSAKDFLEEKGIANDTVIAKNEVKHMASTPIGMRVRFESELIEQDR